MISKIDRANKRCIENSNDLPDVSIAVMSFFQNIKIELIRKINDRGYLKEKEETVLTQGVRQTFTSRQLMMKPEGERTWKWSKLHLLAEPCLKLDDIVRIRGTKYRVMASVDQSEYGFMEYDLLEDYKDEG